MNKKFGLLLVVACIVFPACTPKPVLVADLGDSAKGRAMTADYRWIMSLPQEEQGKPPKNIICTEPSPDVAKAISSALAEGFKVDVTHPSGVKVGASQELQYQTAQAIAQLGKRFATIQILRDMLYNDCLAYANGILTPTAYAMTKARFNSLVVTLLGIEMVSGSEAGPLQIVSSPPLNIGNTGNEIPPAQPGGGSPSQGEDQGGKNEGQNSEEKKNAAKAAMVSLEESYKAFQKAVQALTDLKPSAGTPEKKAEDSLKKANELISQAKKDADAAWKKVETTDVPSADGAKAIQKSKTTADKLNSDAKQKQIIDQAAKNSTDAKKDDAVTRLKEILDKLNEANEALEALLVKKDTSKSATKQPGGSKAKPDTEPDVCCRTSISDQQANAIKEMQHEFMENEAVAPSLLACAAFYDKHSSGVPIGSAAFAEYCTSVFARRIELAKRFNDLVARLAKEGNLDISKLKAVSSFMEEAAKTSEQFVPLKHTVPSK